MSNLFHKFSKDDISNAFGNLFGRSKSLNDIENRRQRAREAFAAEFGTPPFGTPDVSDDLDDVPDVPMPPPTPDPPFPPNADDTDLRVTRIAATVDLPESAKLGLINGITLRNVLLKHNPPEVLVRICKIPQNGSVIGEVFEQIAENIRGWVATGEALGNEMEFAQRFVSTEGYTELCITINWYKIVKRDKDPEEFSREWYEAQRAKGNDNEEI